jgi:hypothetical protein
MPVPHDPIHCICPTPSCPKLCSFFWKKCSEHVLKHVKMVLFRKKSTQVLKHVRRFFSFEKVSEKTCSHRQTWLFCKNCFNKMLSTRNNGLVPNKFPNIRALSRNNVFCFSNKFSKPRCHVRTHVFVLNLFNKTCSHTHTNKCVFSKTCSTKPAQSRKNDCFSKTFSKTRAHTRKNVVFEKKFYLISIFVQNHAFIFTFRGIMVICFHFFTCFFICSANLIKKEPFSYTW